MKKGVNFRDMSGGQKVIHILGWISVVSITLTLAGATVTYLKK
jgi:hypothetical protein